MSRHFLLNLANRSASKATVPLARPYLHPVFMPPAPTFPVVGIQPAPPTALGKTQTTQKRQSSHSRVIPEQTIADSPRRSEPQPPSPSAQSSRREHLPMQVRPVENEPGMPTSAALTPMPDRPGKTEQSTSTAAGPVPMPDRMVENEQSTSAPAGPSPDSHDRSPRPRRKRVSPRQPQQPERIIRSTRPRPDDSGKKPTSPPSPPPERQGHAPQMVDKSQIRSVSQTAASEEVKKPSAIAPAMPAPAVPIRPDVPLTTSVIERIDTPEPRQPRQPQQPQRPQMPQAAIPEPQTTASAVTPAPTAVADALETLAPVTSEVPKTSGNHKPQNGDSTALQALPLTTIIERSTFSETSVRSVQPESPEPIKVERVTPAPEQRHSMQPLQLQSNNTPPIQVSIGTIDLRVQSSEPPRRQPSYRRRRPQGFDGFRQRRLYAGWEMGHE